MKRSTTTTVLCAALAALFAHGQVHAQASTAKAVTGPYIGAAFGTGAEYVLNHNVSFSVELESYGKISEQVKGSTLTVGTRFTFRGRRS